ncbi:MAG: hypothetical protein ACE5HI_19085, partial [bacterium]
MEIRISKYNDVWLDNGLATFYELLKDIEEDESESLAGLEVTENELIYQVDNEEAFIEELSDVIKSKIEHMIVMTEDSNTGGKKQVKKDHILIQEGKKIGGKVAFKESLFNTSSTGTVVQEIFENLNGDKYQCFFCNRPFKKNIKKIQQASYPFVTKIQSLSGIRSGSTIQLTEYISEYCPQCYLNGIVEWLDDSLVYRNIPGIKSFLILPKTENLNDLIKLKNSYSGILNNQARWSNLKVDIDHPDIDSPPGRYSTFMSFYENFLRYVAPEFHHQNWFVIEIPSGTVKNPKYFNIFVDKKIASTLDLLIRGKSLYFYRTFVKQFYAFHTDPKKGIRDFETERFLHEQLCESIVINDFELFASCFVPRKGVKPGIPNESYQILEKLIFYWRIEPMQIENKEEYLNTLAMAGSTLAGLIGG